MNTMESTQDGFFVQVQGPKRGSELTTRWTWVPRRPQQILISPCLFQHRFDLELESVNKLLETKPRDTLSFIGAMGLHALFRCSRDVLLRDTEIGECSSSEFGHSLGGSLGRRGS